MTFIQRIISKKAQNLKRIILILSSISLSMYLMIGLLKKIDSLNCLPFGWQSQNVTAGKTINTKISSLNQAMFEKQIPGDFKLANKNKVLIFKTLIYSNGDQNYEYDLSGARNIRILCNGKRITTAIYKLVKKIEHRLLFLKKGYNEIEIRFKPEKGCPNFFLRFFRKGRIHARKLPFYKYIIPGSSLSKHLSDILQFIDYYIKPSGFILSLIIIFFLIPLVLIQEKTEIEPVIKSRSLGFLFFEIFCFGMASIFSIIFLNNRLHLKISTAVIWSISLLISLIYLIKNPGIKISFKSDIKKLAIIFLIATLIFGYIYKISGQVFPLRGLGGVDYKAHMDMVTHFQKNNEIKTDDMRFIYPQTFHAFLSMVADVLQTSPERIVTLFFAIVFILVYFLIFLLSKHFFPDYSPVCFFLLVIPASFTVIMGSVFKKAYFPPVISIFFFLSALFFFFNKRLILSSVMLAVSLIIYPYFIGIFLITMFFLFINRLLFLQKNHLKNWIQAGLYFLFPVVFTAIYMINYISFRHDQLEAGYSHFFKLNPFTALGPFNSFAILIGIAFLFSNIRKNREILVLVFASVSGFLAYYLPHFFFNLESTYYLLKIMIYLMLFGIILEINALENIYLWFKKSKLFQLIKKSVH